ASVKPRLVRLAAVFTTSRPAPTTSLTAPDSRNGLRSSCSSADAEPDANARATAEVAIVPLSTVQAGAIVRRQPPQPSAERPASGLTAPDTACRARGVETSDTRS